jgi:hypothetical protein
VLAFVAFMCVLVGAMMVANALRAIPRWRLAARARCGAPLAAVDEDWSGLRFVWRHERRSRA